MSYNGFDDFNNGYDDFGSISSTGRKKKKKKNNLPLIIGVVLVAVVLIVAAVFGVQALKGGKDEGAGNSASAQLGGNTGLANANTAVAPTTGGSSSRTAMSAPDLADYVAQRVCTITVTGSDFTSRGTGFFIDGNGTIVTCYHVIDAAQSIEVEVTGGGKFSVEEIVDFDVHHDIAVLRIDMQNNAYLDVATNEVRTGENVYAVGSSLGFLDGTFSNGIVSNTSRNVGIIDCIQTTAAISGGNSGGPLVNEYGEVVGVNAFTYTSGQNLNLAVRIDTLDLLAMDKNFSMNGYREWYTKEAMRSYLVYDYQAKGYIQSMINTYQYVTGQECYASSYDWTMKNMTKGYDKSYGVYAYEYNADNFDKYTNYLLSTGFEYNDSLEESEGTYYLYYNEFTGYYVEFLVFNSEDYLIVEAFCNKG